MTDILYVLADKSKRGSDRELRLSLRSLQKNCKDLGRVFIATDELPDWIKNVEHIKTCDLSQYPEISVYAKILAAIEEMSCHRFLLMNDDFYMIKPFIARYYPYYYRGEMVYIDNPSRWQKVNNKTMNIFLFKNQKILDYCVHCPILCKKTAIRVIDKMISTEIPMFGDCGFSFRSVYGNLIIGADKKQVLDCKLWHGEQLKESGTGCISTADGADDVLDEIEKIFNKKSKFEK